MLTFFTMEKFIVLLESFSFLGKVGITYVFFTLCMMIITTIFMGFKEFDFKSLFKISITDGFAVFCVYLISFFIVRLLVKIVLKLANPSSDFLLFITSHTFVTLLCWSVLFLIIFCGYIMLVNARKDKSSSTSRTSTISRISSNRTFSTLHSSITTSKPSSQRTSNVPGSQRVPIVPISTPTIPKKTTSFVSSDMNMTDVENQLSDGINVRLDFMRCYTRLSKSLMLAKKTGARITLYNLSSIRNYDNFIKIAQQAPGHVFFEKVFDADINVIKLAGSGACFKCDCSQKSSTIKYIAKAAKDGHGNVIFINCSWMNSVFVKELKELGGDCISFNG